MTPETAGLTEKARAKTAASASYGECAAIFDNAVEAIVCIDSHGVITRANPAVATIFGYRAEELIGRNIGCLMQSPERERHDDYIRHYLDTGERRIIGTGREVTGLHRDGSEVSLDLCVVEIRTDGVHHFVGMMRDITERKRTEALLYAREREIRTAREQLAAVDRLRMVNTLATGIAHEMTQPLTAIGLFAKSCRRMVEAGEFDPGRLQEILSRIEGLAHKTGGIITGLREMARPQQVEHRAVDINPLIEDTLELAMMDDPDHAITVDLQLAPDLPPVKAAENQIKLVLLNLIRNARESLAGQDRASEHAIRITSAPLSADTIEVSVQDNGPGIDPEHIDHIFKPFHTGKSAGIGMGLPISRGIIENHGGTLRVNEAFTGGAEFSFTLPVSTQMDVS